MRILFTLIVLTLTSWVAPASAQYYAYQVQPVIVCDNRPVAAPMMRPAIFQRSAADSVDFSTLAIQVSKLADKIDKMQAVDPGANQKIAALEFQLAAKDKQIADKDKQIADLTTSMNKQIADLTASTNKQVADLANQLKLINDKFDAKLNATGPPDPPKSSR